MIKAPLTTPRISLNCGAKPLVFVERMSIIRFVARVLLIDDNDLDRKISRDSLIAAGFAVEDAPDGATGLRLLYDHRPDLILLDVLMPVMDGWTVCSRIRELCDVPIIMLTSLNREEEMVQGLNLGADDFVSKPISPAHLIARVAAVLRRTQSPAPAPRDVIYDDGTLRIDASRHEVRLDGVPVELTPTEFRLLVTLSAQPGRVRTFDALLREVWGPEYADDIDFLRVYIWRLRKKLEADAADPRWIFTERGFGYRFAEAAPR
jgi:two-component system KDP operon response regulator KdpE